MDDLISRQAAIDAVRTYYDDEYALADSIEELIEKLPSAQPGRVRGHWKPDIDESHMVYGYLCDKCGAWHSFKHNYCHNCGADMREDDQ